MQKNLAPVVIFVFSRPEHTKKTIEALLNNKEAIDTDLFIYADAPRNAKDEEYVSEVKKIINNISGFRSINIINRDVNYGLAKNIQEGVTEVCNKYGKVIVLEDDIVTSPAFLHFMNSALNKYKDEKKVWHISGWNYPSTLDSIPENPETYFWRTMNCWGWATWDDRWVHFEKSPIDLKNSWSKEDINNFNLDGACDFWSQVKGNLTGSLNTWAVFWYATIFSHDGLCLNPRVSFVHNIGNDGSGENCGDDDIYHTNIATEFQGNWPLFAEENESMVTMNKSFYRSIKLSLFKRVAQKIKRLICEN